MRKEIIFNCEEKVFNYIVVDISASMNKTDLIQLYLI